jgi:hypothetical protein
MDTQLAFADPHPTDRPDSQCARHGNPEEHPAGKRRLAPDGRLVSTHWLFPSDEEVDILLIPKISDSRAAADGNAEILLSQEP